jgi:hypothetical protein
VSLAKVVRKALLNVVKEGTARRISGAFKSSQGEIVIGGKTGTGDHRRETFSSSGAVLESRVMNRVATFAFFVGDRHYGVITAFVPGETAANYHFTSALPVQLLKVMVPLLQPLILQAATREPTWEEAVARFESEGARPSASPAKPMPPPEPIPAPTPPALPPNLELRMSPMRNEPVRGTGPSVSDPVGTPHPHDPPATGEPSHPTPAPKPPKPVAPRPEKQKPNEVPGEGFHFI